MEASLSMIRGSFGGVEKWCMQISLAWTSLRSYCNQTYLVIAQSIQQGYYDVQSLNT